MKEGGLAPFQDLVYFTEPTEKELKFLQEQHEDFHELIEELIHSESTSIAPLTKWVQKTKLKISMQKPEMLVAEATASIHSESEKGRQKKNARHSIQ